ncbi:MAG: DUF4922 domain-containing protein [bacterium]
MRNNLFLSDKDLLRYEPADDPADRVHALLEQQKDSWKLLRDNYDALDNVETRTFTIDGHVYRVEFNPGRLTSTTAAVDDRSIRERKCFLCPDNLPAQQRAVRYRDDYAILCNPYPIFPEHFTIANVEHVPQQILTSFPVLRQLSKSLSERYSTLYNGPKCGASAPDHLHFQAGDKGFLPIEEEYEKLITARGEKLLDADGLLVFAVGDFLRKFISFESDNISLLQKAFEVYYAAALNVAGGAEEPMMNILASYQEGEWRIILFPRAKHRPSFFFKEGNAKMLISPGAVDLGGVIMTPREEDFKRISDEILVEMFEEVSISGDDFDKLKSGISSHANQL